VICQVLQSFCLVLGYFLKLLFEEKIDLSSLSFNTATIITSYLIPLISSIYIIPCVGLNGTFGVTPDASDIASQALKNPLNLLSLGWDYFNRREITEAEKITAKFCESKMISEKFTGILHVLAHYSFSSWILFKLREANILEEYFSSACMINFCWYFVYPTFDRITGLNSKFI